MKKNVCAWLYNMAFSLVLVAAPMSFLSCSSDEDAQDPVVEPEEEVIEGEEEIATVDSARYYISNLEVADIANAGNGTDLQSRRRLRSKTGRTAPR